MNRVTSAFTGYWFVYWLLIRFTGYWFELLIRLLVTHSIYWLFVRVTIGSIYRFTDSIYWLLVRVIGSIYRLLVTNSIYWLLVWFTGYCFELLVTRLTGYHLPVVTRSHTKWLRHISTSFSENYSILLKMRILKNRDIAHAWKCIFLEHWRGWKSEIFEYWLLVTDSITSYWFEFLVTGSSYWLVTGSSYWYGRTAYNVYMECVVLFLLFVSLDVHSCKYHERKKIYCQWHWMVRNLHNGRSLWWELKKHNILLSRNFRLWNH